jgi:hypothetical protein
MRFIFDISFLIPIIMAFIIAIFWALVMVAILSFLAAMWVPILIFCLLGVVLYCFNLVRHDSQCINQGRTYPRAAEGSYQRYINDFFSILNDTTLTEKYFAAMPMPEFNKMHSAVKHWKDQGGKFSKQESEVFNWMTEIINK